MSDSEMSPKNRYFLDKSRVVAHIDVDCFSCQVTIRSMPDLKGKPFATFLKISSVQVIDSVSYEAKSCGIRRGMTSEEALKECPQLVVINRMKNPGRDVYRKASEQLFEAVKSFCDKSMAIEKTSSDDFYVDLTDKCKQYRKDKFGFDLNFLKSLGVKVEGGEGRYPFESSGRLMRSHWSEAAVYVTDLCDHIFNKTGLRCSAGISVNKTLAKIACKANKPNAITLIESKAGIARLFSRIPIETVDGLGGKAGHYVKTRLKVETLKDLRRFRRQYLNTIFHRPFNGQSLGAFLFEICRGIDRNPVVHKPDFSSLSVSFSSAFGLKCNSREAIDKLYFKCEEFVERLNRDLNRNRRIAHRIRVEVTTKNGRTLSTNLFLMAKTYNTKQIFDQIYAKGFPYITNEVPKVIKQFRLTAFDFKKLCTQFNDPLLDLTQQMHGMSI